MRNLKKLFAVVMVVAMLASIMVPALAADSFKYEADAKKLYDLKLFNGISSTSYVPDLGTGLIRETGLALMIRAAGLQDEVEALSAEEVDTQLAKIVDAKELAEWARPYAAYAVKNGLTNGIDASILPNVKFGAKLPLSGKEFVNFVLKAMGYQVSWDDVLTKSAEVGMLTAGEAVTFGTTAELNRDSAVGILAGALTGKTAAGVTLAQALVDAGAVTAAAMAEAGFFAPTATPTPAPVALDVDSVNTDNLKTLVVEFNKEIDKDSVTASTMKVTNKTVTATVHDDKKTVTLTYADGNEATQSAEVELVIEGVKSADKSMEIKGFKTKYTVADTTIPQVTGIEVVNAKQIDLLVSEPMNFSKTSYQVLNNIKIGGNAVIAKATPNFSTGRISIEFSTVKAAGTYTVEVKDLVDYAGYKALALSKEITILADSTAPVMIAAEAKTLNEIEVTFDESVPTVGTFKVGSTTATATVIANSNNTKYKLTGFGNLDLGAIVEVKITYKGQKDVVGNEVKEETVYSFTVSDDTTVPGVSAVVEKGNKVVVTFTKSMLKVGTIKLYDKDNKLKKTLNVSDLTFKADTNNTVLELSAASLGLDNVDPAQYKLNFKDMKDSTIRANGLPSTDITFDALDTKKPTASDTYLVTLGTKTGDDLGKDDTITIYFSEAMDADTAKNLSNYVIGGVAFSAKTGVSVNKFADDAKSIVITYPQARGLVEGASAITVYAIKDVAGNMMTTNSNVVRLTSTAVALDTVGNAEASATNKIVVTYNTVISSTDPSAIKIQKNGDDYAVGIDAVIGVSGNNAKVTYTLDKAFDTTDTTAFTVVSNNYNLVKNVYGNARTSAFATQNVTDKIRPEIKSVAANKDVDGNVIDNQIKITITEAVYEASAGNLKYDLIIKNKDGKTVADSKYTYTNITGDANASNTIIITFAEDAGLADGTQDITVQLAFDRFLMDKVQNKAVISDVKTVTMNADDVAPTVVSKLPAAGSVVANATHKLVFSEALNTASKANVKTAVENAYTANAPATVLVAWETDNKTLTVTITAAAAPANVTLGTVAKVAVADIIGNTTSEAIDLQ